MDAGRENGEFLVKARAGVTTLRLWRRRVVVYTRVYVSVGGLV